MGSSPTELHADHYPQLLLGTEAPMTPKDMDFCFLLHL